MKIGNWCSVGMFWDKIYTFEHIGDARCHSTYYKINKTEFDDFPNSQSKIVQDIHKIIWSDYVGETEFNEEDYE